ncbi:hypothetical protein [uncultured Sphingomonas sp.]|uniref:hypothetical protein n=1 Tax=uncultured Sphingomonas sp. TaxID=158754 RepID=UPI0025CE7203|nr:hypothetical protein [uncultured Sphingomonas sp.]
MTARAPRPHTGGPERTLAREALTSKREQLLKLPKSPARTLGLNKVRKQLSTLANRSERRGA